MDHTARLRAMKGTIEELQKGEQAMNGEKMGEAETHFRSALKQTPNDYAGLVMMATCQIIQKKPAEGLRYSEAAKCVYPQEAQAYYLSGFGKLQTKNFAGAYQDFSSYEKVLPGNPTTVFLKGYSREGMGNKEEAAKEYHRYLQVVQEGKFAQHAYGRLVEWGYYKR
jgi:TolA-binding protein